MQALWIIALPAFFGMDEFDHAYRASSVADGHWAPGTQLPVDGRGYLIRVPADIVTAAHAPCDNLKYTLPDNCTATSAPDKDDTVLVASGAATYNPVWYAVVGTVAQPFRGDNALLAMRIAGALACDAFLLAAVAVALRRRSSIWPFLGVAVVATPSMIYATAVAAPNGLNYSAAVLMWVAGLALVDERTQHPRHLVIAFTASTITVMLTHTTGTMWVALSLVCAAPLWWGRGRALVRRDRSAFVAGAALIGLAAVACCAWILLAHTNDPAEGMNVAFGRMPASTYVTGPIQWTLQAIATLRFRDTPAPVPVYGLALAVLIILGAAAVRVAHRRLVLALVLIASATTAVPLVLTYLSYDAIGLAWQGRYTLPLSVGFLLLVVEALHRRLPSTPRVVVWGLVGALTLVQTLTVSAAFRENRTGYLHDPVTIVVAGGLVYLLALGLAARCATTTLVSANGQDESPTSRTRRPS